MPAARILGASIPLLLLLIAVFGIPWMLRREKRRSSVPAHVKEMQAWRGLSTQEQAAADGAALDAADAFEWARAEARERAEDAARLAVERAADINVQYHP
jgi:hypothetical protein